jgi:hypothetical protein
MIKFSEWLRLKEISTSTACVAAYPMPVGGFVRLKNKKRLKENSAYQPLKNPLQPFSLPNPNETIPTQKGWTTPSRPEFSDGQYSGPNKKIYNAVLDYYNSTGDLIASEAIRKSLNGDDTSLINFFHKIT